MCVTHCEGKVAYPPGLPLMFQDFKGNQLLHVVLISAIVQNFLCFFKQAAQTLALAEWPPGHVTSPANTFQGGSAYAQLVCSHLWQNLWVSSLIAFCSANEVIDQTCMGTSKKPLSSKKAMVMPLFGSNLSCMT